MKLFRGLMSSVKFNLKHQPVLESTNELSIQLDNSTLATISFVKVDENTYDLVHTLIPEQLQGQGLGQLFAERVFDHLLQHNKQLKLTCEFLQHFYIKNQSKYKGHVIEDFDLA